MISKLEKVLLSIVIGAVAMIFLNTYVYADAIAVPETPSQPALNATDPNATQDPNAIADPNALVGPTDPADPNSTQDLNSVPPYTPDENQVPVTTNSTVEPAPETNEVNLNTEEGKNEKEDMTYIYIGMGVIGGLVLLNVIFSIVILAKTGRR